jgi:hypothetical protein
MSTFQIWIQDFIEDVNKEESKIIRFLGNITSFLFFIIKWAGIPFILYVLWTFSKL